jgi:mannitol/fructose-specific phosphotransferase system IIA component (Ntr-type)
MMITAAPAIPDLSRFIPDLRSRRREGVLAELVETAHRAGVVHAPAPVSEIVRIRERAIPSAIARDAAVIAARSLAIIRQLVVVGRSLRGIEWPGAEDGTIHLVVLVLAPAEWNEEAFHALLTRGAGLIRLQKSRQRLIAQGSDALVATLLRESA